MGQREQLRSPPRVTQEAFSTLAMADQVISVLFTMFRFYTFKNIAITINYGIFENDTRRITLIFRDFLMGSKGSELDDLTMVADLSHWINVAETDCNDMVKRSLRTGFFWAFSKNSRPKNSTFEKTQGHFLPKNSICRDFLRLHTKNSMRMTSISIHFLKQMVSIDNYKEGKFFSSNK